MTNAGIDPALPGKYSEPRERLLRTACRLFYAEGIQAVGVDRLLLEAGVSRATFYRHFAGKDDLVAAYIDFKDRELREQYREAQEFLDQPQDLLRAIVVGIAATVCGPGFRGCPFINAAAEYPDQLGSVRQAIHTHRTWFHRTLLELYSDAGHSDPSVAAHRTVLLRDGAMVGGYLGDSGDAIAALQTGVDEILAALPSHPSTG